MCASISSARRASCCGAAKWPRMRASSVRNIGGVRNMLAPSISISRRALHALDDQRFYQCLARLQSQPQLLLEGGKKGGPVFRAVGVIGRPGQSEIVKSGETCLVDHLMRNAA